MDKLIMCRAKAVLLLAFFVISGSSCVNEDYDLSEDNLNLEITPFVDGLTLPLGKTDRIELQQLLAEVDDNLLAVDEASGAYSITYNDSFWLSNDMSDLAGMLSIPGFNYRDNIGFNFSNPLVRSAVALETRVSKDMVLEIMSPEKVSDEVLSIGLVELVSAQLSISINGSDLNLAAGSSLAFDFDLKVPDMLKVPDADENGIVNIKGELRGNQSYWFSVPIEAIDLTGTDLKSDVKATISLSGVVKLDVASGDVTQWVGKNHNLGINVILPSSTRISKMACRLDYEIDPVYQTIDLGEVKSFFDELGSEANLDFHSIKLALDVKTNMGTPINASLDLIPYYNGVANNAKVVHADIAIKASASADAKATTNYVFDEKKLNEALETIPEKFELRMTACTDTGKDSIIEPDAYYSMSADYGFELPLAFGKDFSITYRDKIPDIAPVLASILSNGCKVKLAGVIENSLPLGLDLQLNFLDSNDRPVPAVKNTGVQSIAPCDQNGNPVKTTLDIIVALEDQVKAEDIASLELVFVAASKGIEGIQATTDDYLQAEFQLVLPEGATLNLNDFINGEDEQ